MHSVVKERLEEYLGGALAPAALHQIEAHLNACKDCREEVTSMQEVRQLFSSLRAEDAVTPSAGFYVRVLEQVGAEQRELSFASLFALDFAFGRRLVFASLLTLAVLGSYLVSRETNYSPGPSPEAVMAQDSSSPTATDRDHMLVALTSYEP
jgi:predicted anti-sigma-YlaC factor YlaD